MTLREFVRENKEEIDKFIIQKAGENFRGHLNYTERCLWIMNDETLYNWAMVNDVGL